MRGAMKGFFGWMGRLVDSWGEGPGASMADVVVGLGMYGEPILMQAALLDRPELLEVPAALRRGLA